MSGFTEAEMDRQDTDYQVKRINALERLAVTQSEEIAALRGLLARQERALREEFGRWLAESEGKLEQRVAAVEENATYLMSCAHV